MPLLNLQGEDKGKEELSEEERQQHLHEVRVQAGKKAMATRKAKIEQQVRSS